MPYLLLLVLALAAVQPARAADACPESLNFTFRTLAGKQRESLCERYAGKVVLVVNTASYCGFTPQYQGLEALYRRYRERGLVVLGFPSNDFAQEPDSEGDIQNFCKLTFDVGFPMFEKTHVRQGDDTHPFYRKLAELSGAYPRWNFHKYLIDRSGTRVTSFATRVDPEDPDFVKALEALL